MDQTSDVSETTIERSPADVLRLVVATVALAVVLLVWWLFGDDLVGFAARLFGGLRAFPQWIINVTIIATRILAVVLLAGGLVWALWHGRWRMLVTVGIAGVVSAGIAALLRDVGAHRRPTIEVSGNLGPLTYAGFPTLAGIAIVTSVLTAGAPWLTRRWRQLGWLLVIGLVLSRLFTAPMAFNGPVAALEGWFIGAAVLVAMGAPTRRPTIDSVRAGLAAVGLPVRELSKASVDARGSTPYFGEGEDGTKLFVKALGEDERSADLLFRLYRGVRPRAFGDERPFSSLRRGVEHEALVALAASSYGVRTPAVLAFASAEPNAYVLAYAAIAGRSFDRLEPAEITDDVLASIWSLVAQLRVHRIAHRDLRLANIFLDDSGVVWLIDFGFSELAASDLLLANDVAELIASSSEYVEPARAVALARAAVDDDTLARAADRLHPWALSGATRTMLKGRPGLLDALRGELTAAPAAAPTSGA
jgi:undecaprenyl-diphosphatase